VYEASSKLTTIPLGSTNPTIVPRKLKYGRNSFLLFLRSIESMIRPSGDDRERKEEMVTLELRGKRFTADRNKLIKVPGTYFSGMLSSGAWQPNSDGVYVIDRYSEGFDRILDCLSSGKLNCKGLTDYEIECVYDNLDYFLIPFVRITDWDYSKVSTMDNDMKAVVFFQLDDGRLCGSCNNCYHSNILVFNMDRSVMETRLKGHTSHITGIIRLDDGRICSCSWDKSIKLSNIESCQCELTIEGHTSYVYCIIQLIDGRLCSGSDDATIKIWNKDTGVCLLIIEVESTPYCLVQLKDGRICSGVSKWTIKIWNISTGVCEMTIVGLRYSTSSIVVIDDSRICACTGKEIKIWNINSGICERTLEGHKDHINRILLLEDGRICSVGLEPIVKLWNIETGVCELSVAIDTPHHLDRVVQLHDGRLVVSDYSQTIFIVGGIADVAGSNLENSSSRCSLC
jgi:WD40 repeat protein